MPAFPLQGLVSRFGVRSLLLLIALVAAFPVLTLLGWQIAEDHAEVLAHAHEDVQELANLAAERQGDLIAESNRTLQMLGHLADVADAVPGRCEAILRSVAGDHPRFSVIGVATASGAPGCTSARPDHPGDPLDPAQLPAALDDQTMGSVFVILPGGRGLSARALLHGAGGKPNLAYIVMDLRGAAAPAVSLYGADNVVAAIVDPITLKVLAALAGPGVQPEPPTGATPNRELVTSFARVAGAGTPQLMMIGVTLQRILATSHQRLPMQAARALVAAGVVFVLVWTLAWLAFGAPIRALMDAASRQRLGASTDRTAALPREFNALFNSWTSMASSLEDAQTEQAHSEQLHRLLSENATDMITVISRDNDVTYISSAARDILGYTVEELMRGGLGGLAHPEGRSARESIMRALSAGTRDTATQELKLRHRDGHWVSLEVKYRLVRDPVTGEPMQVVTAGRDITERQQREQALRESEARLRLLADNSVDIIMHIGPDHRRRYVSPGCREVLGFTPEEMMASDFQNHVHPDDAPWVTATVRQLKEGERITTRSYRVRHKNGHYIWVGNSVRRLAGEEGFVMVIRDLTSANQAEARLLEQRRFFQALFEHTTDALLVMRAMADGDFALRDINAAGARLLDLPAGSALGRSPWALAPGPYGARLHADLLRCQRERAAIRFEADAAFGAAGNWEVVHAPLLGEDGAVEHILVSLRDISHIKAAEIAAAQSNRWLVMAEHIAGIGHWWLRLPDAELVWSAEIYRIFELDPAYPPPTADAAVASYHPADQAAIRRGFEELIAHGTPQEFQARLIRRDGEVRHLQARAVPELSPDGAVVGAFGILRDITEQIQAQAELQQARDAAEAAQRVLEELALEDALTGLANRRQFDGTLAEQLRRGVRDQTPLALALLDVDHFKQFNDRYGHVAGDECLRSLGVAVQSCLKRAGDLAARYGGEEFAVLAPDTDLMGVRKLAEDICLSVHSLRIEHLDNPHGVVTISIGVAAILPSRQDTSAAFIGMADVALYQAKAAGRNQVRSYYAAEPASMSRIASF